MTRNRGRGSRFQVWVAVPTCGLLAGGGLAVLTAQGLDRARSDGAADVPSAVDATEDDDGEGEDPVAAALRVRAADAERPTLVRPAAAVSPVLTVQPTSLMVATVLSSPVWSSVAEVEYVPPPPAVVATPPAPPAPPAPAAPPPVVTTPPVVVTPPVVPENPTDPQVEEPPVEEPPVEEPPVEEPPVEEPPVEEPTDPSTAPVDETATDQTVATGTEPVPPGPLVQTVG